MPSLIGNKPNQVPSNGDLGTLAFQDASNVKAGSITADTVLTTGNVGVGTSSPSTKVEISGSNEGATSNTTLRFSDTDTFTQANQPLGIIEFYGADTSGPGAGIKAKIGAYSASSNGESRLTFSTSSTATNDVERMRIDSDGNLLFNSGYGSVATAYGCRAWVNFNGVGTVSIRGSGNVSSVNDVGTGHYGVIFANAMPNTNYAVATSVSGNTNNYMRELHSNIVSTSEVRILHFFSGDNANTTMALADADPIHVSIFR